MFSFIEEVAVNSVNSFYAAMIMTQAFLKELRGLFNYILN